MVEECKVVQANGTTRTIRVERLEHGDVVSGEIKVFRDMPLPPVNSYVACIFTNGKGFVIGELE